MTQSSFFISAGFRLGSSGLSAGLGLSNATLTTINAILGDTETSKAIATIIVLVQHEIKTSETGIERINFGDALAGSVGFVLLQRWGWEKTEKHLSDSEAVKTVWDVVILDQGDALLEQTSPLIEDVSEQPRPRAGRLSSENRPSSFISLAGESELSDAPPFDDGISVMSNVSSRRQSTGPEGMRPELLFKSQLSQQLKSGIPVHISTQSVLKNMVAVEVENGEDCNIGPPPGFALVAVQKPEGEDSLERKYVFQNVRKRFRRGSFEVESPPLENMSAKHTPYPSTPIEITGESDNLLEGHHHVNDRLVMAQAEDSTNRGWAMSPEVAPIKANEKRPRSPLRDSLERRDSTDGYFAEPTDYSVSEKPQREEEQSEKTNKRSAFKKNLKRGTSYGKLVDFWNSGPHMRNKKLLADRIPPRARTFDHMPWITNSNRPPSPSRPHSPWLSDEPSTGQICESRTSTENDRKPENINGMTTGRTGHRRTASSVFSLKTNASETSLVLRAENQRSTRERVAESLERNNTLPGQYPHSTFTANVARFARFSVAAYGSSFIRFTGAGSASSRKEPKEEIGPLDRHQSFTSYTGLPDSTVLLSSYVDPEGGAHMEGHADTGMPLIHYISLDHDSKAVVLTCRGTLGFEDVLIDMTCDYDTFLWQGKSYQVHEGMLASARRLLTLHGNRLIATIKAALEEFEDYGLVLCGHSLGGGVCSILGMLISQPNPQFRSDSADCPAFITAQPPSNAALSEVATTYNSFPPHPADALAHTLPPNRAVHVYAYGPAASISPALSQVTRGLITTIINNADVVPYLSLGNIRDFQSIALAFKQDTGDAKGEMRKRVWESLRKSVRDRTGLGSVEAFFAREWHRQDTEQCMEDEWPWIALESLRGGLTAAKLLPPGECFIVQRKAVLQRFAFTEPGDTQVKASVTQPPNGFKPASHIRVVHVRDVARRFGELRFQGSMFLDHLPSRYERILEALEKGVA